jgi:predicted nucleotidyltransferase component of viral defense system
MQTMLEFEQIESFYPEKLKVFKKNILREYLQYKILEIIYNSAYSNKLVFMGGTALRIIYDNTRFSEDLDFDNLGMTFAEFLKLAEMIKEKLILEGYEVEAAGRQRGAFIASVKIKDILYDFGFSTHSAHKMNLEIDAETQNFKYQPDQKLLNKFDVFTSVFAVPIDILLSQKIFAILKRPRTMGRDLYDVVFLFGRTRPNLKYLKDKSGLDNMLEIKEALILKLKGLDLKKMAEDIKPFIFEKTDARKIEFFMDYLKSP